MVELAYFTLIISLLILPFKTVIEIIQETKARSGFASKLSITLQVIICDVIGAIIMIKVAIYSIETFMK
ncbi:MAG: hypothetical protein ACRC6H_00360 [Culicoidibacterales bacterium]